MDVECRGSAQLAHYLVGIDQGTQGSKSKRSASKEVLSKRFASKEVRVERGPRRWMSREVRVEAKDTLRVTGSEIQFRDRKRVYSSRRIQGSEVKIGHSCGGRVASVRATLTNPSNLDCTNLRAWQCALVEFHRSGHC